MFIFVGYDNRLPMHTHFKMFGDRSVCYLLSNSALSAVIFLRTMICEHLNEICVCEDKIANQMLGVFLSDGELIVLPNNVHNIFFNGGIFDSLSVEWV